MPLPHDPDLDPVVPATDAGLDRPQGMPPQRPRTVAPAPVVKPADAARWSTTVRLDYPVTVDGAPLDVLHPCALTGDEFMEAVLDAEGNEDALMQIVRGRMCGVHPAVIGGLHADDQARVVVACRPFLPRPLRDDPDLADTLAQVGVAAG